MAVVHDCEMESNTAEQEVVITRLPAANREALWNQARRHLHPFPFPFLGLWSGPLATKRVQGGDATEALTTPSWWDSAIVALRSVVTRVWMRWLRRIGIFFRIGEPWQERDEGPGLDVEVCWGWLGDGRGRWSRGEEEKWAGCNPALRWGCFGWEWISGLLVWYWIR